MSITYIQKHNFEFRDINTYTAWYAAAKAGHYIKFFGWSTIKEDLANLTPSDLVIGGVEPIRFALNQLGIKPPDNIDYPDQLYSYFHRTITKSTLKAAHSLIGKNDKFTPPVFIKPLQGHKLFDGHVLRTYRDTIKTASFYDQNPEIWLSSEVNFLSEFRCFVQENKVVGMMHYKGNPLILPDPDIIRGMVKSYRHDSPIAYGLDVGVLSNHTQSTALVEINDGFALGCYGLNPFMYLDFITARWKQLMENIRV